MRTTFTLRRFAATLALVGMALSAHAQDPLSYARYDQVRTTDLHLDLKADFASKTLSGYAELTLTWIDKSARNLVLDTRQLSISRVQVLKDGRWRPASYMLDKFDAKKGQALRIALPGQPEKVRIYYRTAPTASALQWMTPAQTLSGKRPFMFSQSETINARSWAPVQDTPAVRFTYSARVSAPSGMRVVMSAENDQNGPGKDGWTFRMPQPIPSYLLAIAIGEIGVRNIGPRSAVYAEPKRLDAAAFELADTEKMIAAAEALYGPYRWGRYDMIVLPPSFPIGGMENPRLTFLTPTMIAGDRSLNDLIAHELAHSWSGNLVTNASWKHWWLNEGFTTYVTTRILEVLYGTEVADMNLQVEQEEALASLKEIPAAKQALVPREPDVNPDSYTDEGLAYPKGAWFLRTLEQRAGREAFDPFLRAWFDQHAFQSATTEQFVAFLRANLLSKHPDIMPEAELDEWLHGPGIPATARRVVSSRFAAVDGQRDAWLKGEVQTADLSARGWSAAEWMHFLNDIDRKASTAQLKELDDTFSLRRSSNNEIAFRFYLASVHAGYRVRDELNAFLLSVGRQKFVVPLYTALLQNPNEAAWARSVYAKARPRYHPETQSSVDKQMKK
ncbi:M1 family metallopeptidase [Massilia endophytica]|uniref:M1 family metallopeptidase n=1 Tax=Massilia endophytica TaxID=2899220 RepID=UPI001E55D1DC|nr:M1 family metallopeptidase [Massilia endophytica]UGQ46678.1 M1 family metallopeptidase [Massilia endophytica]